MSTTFRRNMHRFKSLLYEQHVWRGPLTMLTYLSLNSKYVCICCKRQDLWDYFWLCFMYADMRQICIQSTYLKELRSIPVFYVCNNFRPLSMAISIIYCSLTRYTRIYQYLMPMVMFLYIYASLLGWFLLLLLFFVLFITFMLPTEVCSSYTTYEHNQTVNSLCGILKVNILWARLPNIYILFLLDRPKGRT